MVKYSDEQQAIIDAGRSNILVSAAAGSGKTTVLAARITAKIIKKEFGIDELLVVTFTKDAASHMREKIEDSLRKAMYEEGADRAYIKEQIDKISVSYIQTMNSFCNRVVSEAGYMFEDDEAAAPGSMVLEATTLDMIRKQAANDSIMAVYDRIAQDAISEQEREDFLNLLFSMGNGKSEAPLADAMDKAYGKLRSLPDYVDIIDGIIRARESADAEGELIGLDRLVDYSGAFIRKVEAAVRHAADAVDSLDIKAESKASLKTILSSYEVALSEYNEAFPAAVSVDEKLNAITGFYDRLFASLDPEMSPGLYERNKIKDDKFLSDFAPVAKAFAMIRDRHKSNGVKLKNAGWGWTASADKCLVNGDLFVGGDIDTSVLLKRQLRRTSCARAFAMLLKDMDARYSKYKRDLRGIDYGDQEHMCLRILKQKEASDLYRNKFKEIYIDEYQDNTSLQDAVVEKIADGNVFCVGDVKQSIYKFRNANPAMFIRKSEEYVKDPSKGRLMGLNCNFRSTPQVLKFVNEIFGQLMSGDAAQIDYEGGGHELNAPEGAKDGPVPEVIFINAKMKDKAATESEEGLIEEDVKQIEMLVSQIRSKVQEYLDSGYDRKDIFVLTRTNNAAKEAAAYLRAGGIPARCLDKKPLFSDNEIIGICNLIKVLANEYRDECLAGVMLSAYRFSNFILDELAEIIGFAPSEFKKMNLIIKVRHYADNGPVEAVKNKCKVFLDAIDDLRSESVIRDISELTELIYVRSGIKATLMEEAPYEVNKLDLFKNWLCGNFLMRGSDLTEVAGAIDQMQSRLDDDAAIEFDLGGEDLVRCMSYHKSKGLENKCVIVVDVDGSNEKDTNPYISFKSGNVLSPEDHKGPRFIVDDYDDETSVAGTSLEKAVVKEENRLEENAEAMRLLYVALTRAEENLCFIRRIDLSSDKLAPSVFTPLASEGRKLSSDFYTNISGIDKMMLTALLRMKLSEDSSDLKDICGIGDMTFSYNSDFDGVKVTVKTATDAMDRSSDDEPEENIENTDYEVKEYKKTEADLRRQKIFGCVGTDEAGMPKFEAYRYEDAMNAPAKTSVSAMKRDLDSLMSKEDDYADKDLKTAINLLVPDTDHYVGEHGGLSGTALGTAVHKTMRFIDLAGLASGVSASSELDALVSEGILNETEREAVGKFEKNIEAFASSDLCKEFIKADEAGRADRERELICSIRINPDRDDYKLVQGTLDAMYIDDDGKAVIIDYKTDYIKSDNKDEIIKTVKDRHAEQLELYAAAVESSGIPVKARYVYLLRKNMAIEV
ncbi:MAG: UvrD-helicase domain-containing protein [Saccharofermentans sp.]|nr:UvrD-helicase domain-containing protein [Saccharofermentans sp.]